MDDSLYIAVDLGAGSGRVFLVGVASEELFLEEVRRFHYPPTESAGALRWNLPNILNEIKVGMRQAGETARKLERSVRSIGVDSWGVDYGLIGSEGELLENPVCYRDSRTQDTMEQVFARVTRDEIFERTGIQFLVFNTLYQLYAHMRTGIPERAARLLLIPDLIHFFLTGRAVTEHTNATTTQMVHAVGGSWDWETLDGLGLPKHLFTEIVAAGTDLGWLTPSVAEELRLQKARVVAPATHDTGSAVMGAPLEDGWAYISSGTWSLVGVERDSVLINREVERQNFTNEGGAFGTVRFLKNVMGLWILESCRREWKEKGLPVEYGELLNQVGTIERSPGLIFPDDPRFFNPGSMLQAIAEQLAESGQQFPDNPASVAKIVLDSLALRYASVLRTVEALTGRKMAGVQIVGGGSQNLYLNQAAATATGLPVLAGPLESTVIGNALVQAITAGRFASLSDARKHVARNVNLNRFRPSPSPVWEAAARRYESVESRFLTTRKECSV